MVAPGFTLRPDPLEVAEVFEVPLAFILFYIVKEGASSLNWAFFTELPKPVHMLYGPTSLLLEFCGHQRVPWQADGSLRPTAPLTRLFTQDAYTEYALLEPGSHDDFRLTALLPNDTATRDSQA